MSTETRKVLSLGERAGKKVYIPEPKKDSNQPFLSSVSSEDFGMDNYRDDMGQGQADQRFNRYKNNQRPKKRRNNNSYDHTVTQGEFGQEDNKVRRGPGRRLAKDKRANQIDPALMNKYSQLSPALQEKVNATIEIYYQQQMAKAYKGELVEEVEEEDHYEEDVVYETEE